MERPDTGAQAASPGLSDEHKTALTEAMALMSNGETKEAAVAHLVASGMPKVVATVLLRQYERTSQSSLLRNATSQ